MPPKEKVVILIPAYNEEKNIGRTIGLISRAIRRGVRTESHFFPPTRFSIVVVDDGSTDKTARIAREKGCEVVRLSKNVGKANAFFAGVKRALRKKPLSVLLLDADLLSVPKSTIQRMVSIATRNTLQKTMAMVVAGQSEKNLGDRHDPPMTYYSGCRAFSIPALLSIRQSRVKGMIRGYGLELFLNYFFRHHAIEFSHETPFKTMAAYREMDARRDLQAEELRLATKRLERLRKRYKARRVRCPALRR